jgi:hypothetical protein
MNSLLIKNWLIIEIEIVIWAISAEKPFFEK